MKRPKNMQIRIRIKIIRDPKILMRFGFAGFTQRAFRILEQYRNGKWHVIGGL